jgi:hypothetical protein
MEGGRLSRASLRGLLGVATPHRGARERDIVRGKEKAVAANPLVGTWRLVS